jgi:ABC-type transporter Mla subunit MlaD
MDPSKSGQLPDWAEVWPGLLILAALVAVSLITFFGDAVRRATAEGPRLTILAPEVGGLERGSPVWVAGKPSGRVLGLHFLEPGGAPDERVAIDAVLLREAIPYLRADARVTVGASGLMAPSVVKIGAGSPGAARVEDGDTLRAVQRPDLDDFRSMADSVRDALAIAAEDVSMLRREAAEGNGSTARFLADRGLISRMDSAREVSSQISSAWRDGRGLRRLLDDDSLRAVVARSATAIEDLMASEAARASADSVRDVGLALENLRSRTGEIAARLDAAEGTLGRASKDSALAVAAQRTRAVLDSLTAELGANPLAWLRIRLF